MPIVNIAGTNVNIPDSGASPNWAPAIIEAFQLIAEALAVSVGPFDITPQSYQMTSNVNTNVPIPNLSFPVNTVQGSIILYGVNRSSSGGGAQQVSETGLLILNYDPSQSVGSLWQVTHEYSSANSDGALITFSVTDLGQVLFSTEAITGSSPEGVINFRALAVLQS